jgi:hypothetical protein
MTASFLTLLRYDKSINPRTSSGFHQAQVLAIDCEYTSAKFNLIVRSHHLRVFQTTGIISIFHLNHIGYAQFPDNSPTCRSAAIGLNPELPDNPSKENNSGRDE